MSSQNRVIPGTEVNIRSNKVLAMRFQVEREHPYPPIPSQDRQCIRLICCVEGISHHIVDNQRYALKRGDILIIPPKVEYHPSYVPGDVCEEIVMICCPSFFHAMTILHPDIQRSLDRYQKTAQYRCSLSDMGRDNMVSAFEAIYKEYTACRSGWEMVMCSTAVCIVATVFRPEKEELLRISDREDLLFGHIIPYIENNFNQPLTLEDIAEHFLISSSKLCRLFRQFMGISCYQYMIQHRLAVAQLYLLEGIAPKQIWSLCGFSDYTSFYRHYKKAYGISPSNFSEISK